MARPHGAPPTTCCAGRCGYSSELKPSAEAYHLPQDEHGDYATNVALALASKAGRPPREIAEVIVRHLPTSDIVDRSPAEV